MKNYFKILLITFAVQLCGYVIGGVLTNLPIGEDIFGSTGLLICLLGFPISIVVDIILANKWAESKKQKLCYTLLMVTNYTWLMLLLYAFWYIDQWIKMLLSVN